MDNELYHYGVKGMKWGVRRNKIVSKGDPVPKRTNWRGYGTRTHVGKDGVTRTYSRDMYNTKVTLNGKTMKEHAASAKKRAASAKEKREADKIKDWSDDARKAHAIKKKSIDQMSNKELQELNKRQDLENRYKNNNPSTIKKGMQVLATAAVATTTILTLYNNGGKLRNMGNSITDQVIEATGNILVSSLKS